MNDEEICDRLKTITDGVQDLKTDVIKALATRTWRDFEEEVDSLVRSLDYLINDIKKG